MTDKRADDRMNEKTTGNARGVLCLAAGLLLMGLGVFRGETATVLNKAINICLECIGIG